ncbi:choice-of-anchor P family protein [Lentzea sp. BCCO 10_0856]|uniref:Choice-of-anchor P family protein n=1 Tax=Lentzea miocenica TaxID=3095431 RepID=A0ABU4SS58_9PSEU|nr:choice-of-anchor P family protein [Lentzea sp. BCCO 10_0856]MDX8028740.1 choice-of-anchor P family protein [Lentzea sp. BCCO 10_0856]
MRYALVLLLLLLSPAPARAADIGGFTLSARATPVSVLLTTDLLPVPAEPQGEVHLSYTQTELGSGPIGRSVASSLWPGAAVGTGLPQLLGFAYPVQANAAHPGGPADESKSGMRAGASASKAESYAGAKQEVPFLLTADGLASTSVSSVSGTEARSAAVSSAQTITLLAGLVVLSGVRFESVAVSDGSKGSGTSTFSVAEFTVLKQKFPVTAPGAPPDGLLKALEPLGITLTWPSAATKLEGTAATSTSRGLKLTVDVLALRTKLGLGGILDGIVAPLLPKELVPLLNPLRKMEIIVGDTEAVANASASAPLTPPDVPAPQAPLVPPPPADGAQAPSPDSPPVAGVAPPRAVTPVASARAKPRSLLDFPGVPALLVLTGLGVAAAGAFGMKSFGTFLLGGAPCPSGHPTGVPDLRNG